MPKNVDEKYWNKAKSRAQEQGHTEDWPYVMSIYQAMTKNKKKGFLTLMHDVAAVQKQAGLRDRLSSAIKKLKSIYLQTEPLRETQEPVEKKTEPPSLWYKFKKISELELPEQRKLKPSGVGPGMDSFINHVKSLLGKDKPTAVIKPDVVIPKQKITSAPPTKKT
jgi:hypothetical protein